MLKRVGIFICALFIATCISGGIAQSVSDVADIKLYFNGEELQKIKETKLKEGERFEVAVKIQLKKDRNVSAVLSSSGFRSNEKQPYQVIEGPTGIVDAWGKRAGDIIEIRWALKPTDAWVGGSAPLNIDFTFRDPITLRAETSARTIANIYIEPAGATPAPAAATPRQPGFEVIAALAALGLAAVAGRLKRP